jgi:hypothetical protein
MIKAKCQLRTPWRTTMLTKRQHCVSTTVRHKQNKFKNQASMKKYPRIDKVEINQITEKMILEFLSLLATERRKIVISSMNLLKLVGAPVSSNNWVLNEKARIKKIKSILKELEFNGRLAKRELKQEFLGIKEIGYDIIN